MGGEHLWDAVGAIGELVGALAVVVSILYLAAQIRANTRIEKARASFDATHSWAATTDMLFQQPEETLNTVIEAFNPECDPEAMSDEQFQRMTFLWRAIGQKLEGQYYLFKFGFLEPDIWRKRSSILKGVIELPFGAAWWLGELEAATFSDEFVEAMKRTVGIDATSINKRQERD